MAKATLNPAVVEKVVTETVIEEETITLTLSRDEASFIHAAVAGMNGDAAKSIGLDGGISYRIYNSLQGVLWPNGGSASYALGQKFRQYLRDFR